MALTRMADTTNTPSVQPQNSIQEQVQTTGEAIFKAPENFSDLIVTGSAVIAIAIVVSYGFRGVTKLLGLSGKTGGSDKL